MRPYTLKELEWEYRREYLVYSRPRFPGMFADFEDFRRQYDAAPTITYDPSLRLANFSGPYEVVSDVVKAMSHRRDVDAIIVGITNGTLPPPILIKHGDWLHVMSGNTRLSVASSCPLSIARTLECKVIEYKGT